MKLEWKTCLKVGVTVLLLYLCITYWSAISGLISAIFSAALPLILGSVIAYVINILMSFYEKHYFPKSTKSGVIKSRRPVCMIGAFVTLVLIVAALGALVVPELVSCGEVLVAKVPGALDTLVAWVEKNEIVSEELIATLQQIDWEETLNQLLSLLSTGASDIMGTAVNILSSFVSGIVTFVLALIFSLYVLTGKEKLGVQFDKLMKRYMKEKVYDKTKYVLSVVNDCFHRYIVGQCTEAVILGVLCALGMMILRLPYAGMIGALVAFTALIPVAGAYIGAGVGAFMILTESPMQALIFLIFIVVLQQVEGNVIYPRVVGSSMGLPAIWVLAAVTIGGGVMGILGMLLGVPIAAALYRLIKEDVNKIDTKKVKVEAAEVKIEAGEKK